MAENGKIEKMFDDIAPRYDMLNRLMSFGLDKLWRKKLLHEIKKFHVEKVLDIATGTADVAIAMAKEGYSVTGADISERMLEIGRKKLATNNLTESTTLLLAAAESLPFEDNTFDVVTVAFGVRNFADLHGGLSEARRVLRNGGHIAILELSYPDNRLLLWLYKFYTLHIIPFFCGLISGNAKAYKYLPNSILRFPKSEKFISILESSGFTKAKEKTLSFGSCHIYLAEK